VRERQARRAHAMIRLRLAIPRRSDAKTSSSYLHQENDTACRFSCRSASPVEPLSALRTRAILRTGRSGRRAALNKLCPSPLRPHIDGRVRGWRTSRDGLCHFIDGRPTGRDERRHFDRRERGRRTDREAQRRRRKLCSPGARGVAGSRPRCAASAAGMTRAARRRELDDDSAPRRQSPLLRLTRAWSAHRS
jgi:hypothetical protein